MAKSRSIAAGLTATAASATALCHTPSQAAPRAWATPQYTHSGRASITTTGRCWAWVTAVVIAILVLLACASRQPVRVSDPVLAAPDAQQAAYRNVCALLTRRQLRQYDFLDDWTADHLLRLEVWLRGGIRFEGPWTSQELSDILQVLDAFGSAFGSARFVELLDTAVDARTGGREHHLRLVHEPGFTPPAAGWYARSGRIVLTDGLWNAEYMALHHTWSFLTGPYVPAGSATANRHVVVGHELGHVIVDGLRIEALAREDAGLCIEGLYSGIVPKAQWPHFDAGTNEHLATEVAVWALGIGRTPKVEAFRTTVLIPMAGGPDWPAAVTGGRDPAACVSR